MDMQKAIKYFQVLSELPEEVNIFLQSNLFSSYIKKLNNDHKVAEGYLTDLTIDLFSEGLVESSFSSLLERISRDLRFKPDKIKDLLADYLGFIFLPIDSYLRNLNTRSKITQLGADPREYSEKVDGVKSLIEDFVFEEIKKEVAERERHFDVKRDEQIMENMFQNELVYILKNPEPELNSALISLLFADESFKNTLAKHIVNNQQLLFEKEISVDGKKFVPSISNWINNFISSKGSVYFNNLSLSDYVTNSRLSRDLKSEEKDLLIKLLIIYRNIRFFPKSLENVSMDKWEVFPLNVKSKSEASGHQPLAVPKSPEELEIENLEKMAAGYELGSLERRAVEEEIRKMKLSIRYQGAVRK